MNPIYKKLNSVKVVFENSKYNYETSVSADSTKDSCEQYFVGQFFNVGRFPDENLQKCIGIQFTDNNQPTLNKFYQLAYNAYRNTSFSPEKRRDTVIKEYSEELENDLLKIEDEIEKERYKQNYENYFSSWLSAKSRCISTMITGPANFPVRRAEKANRSEERKYKEFREWRERALKAIEKRIENEKPTHVKQAERFEIIKSKIIRSAETIAGIDSGKERGYSRALFVNSISGTVKTLAKNGDSELVKLSLELIKSLNEKYDKPIIANKNSIWKLSEIAEAKKEEIIDNSTRENEKQIINGIELVKNFQADRVQIFFNGKPSQDIINRLKSNAWRWSPSSKCWQRKFTRQAEYDAINLINSIK